MKTERPTASLDEGWRPPSDSKFPWYLGLIGLYSGISLAMAARARRRKRDDMKALTLGDWALLSLAAFQAGRVLSLDEVTRPVRAPFVYESERGEERKEEPRPEGWRGALGELLLCSDCTGFWAAVILTYGYLLAPAPARALTTPLAVSALGTLLNNLTASLEDAAGVAAHPKRSGERRLFGNKAGRVILDEEEAAMVDEKNQRGAQTATDKDEETIVPAGMVGTAAEGGMAGAYGAGDLIAQADETPENLTPESPIDTDQDEQIDTTPGPAGSGLNPGGRREV